MSGKSSEGLKSAADVAKQVIALATGVIAVTVTFFEKLEGSTPSVFVRVSIGLSWLLFIGAIGFALALLLVITQSLDTIDQVDNGEIDPPDSLRPPGAPPPPPPPPVPAGKKPPKRFEMLPSVWDWSVRIPAAGMVLCFGVGLLLTAVASCSSSSVHPAASSSSSGAAPSAASAAAASALGPEDAGPLTQGGQGN